MAITVHQHGCSLRLATECPGAGGRSRPICRRCWAISSTDEREDVKAAWNALHQSVPEELYCRRRGCWAGVAHRYAKEGFCSWYMSRGQCQKVEVSDDESQSEMSGVSVPDERATTKPPEIMDQDRRRQCNRGGVGGGGGRGSATSSRARSRSARRTAALRESLRGVRAMTRLLSALEDVLTGALFYPPPYQ